VRDMFGAASPRRTNEFASIFMSRTRNGFRRHF
jgi:hypothetical protein